MGGFLVLATWVLVLIPSGHGSSSDIMRARIEKDFDCQMFKFAEAKDFIDHDLPLFHNLQKSNIGGKVPELFLINRDYEYSESFRIDLLTKQEINNLLLALGFYKKSKEDDEVPESYQKGPYVRNETEMEYLYNKIAEKEDEELEKKRAEELEKQRAGELEKQRAEELEKQRAGELEKQRAEELEKQKAVELENQETGELEKQRAGELEEQKDGELEKQRVASNEDGIQTDESGHAEDTKSHEEEKYLNEENKVKEDL